MLEIHNVDIQDSDLSYIKRRSKKTQILLYDTKRRHDDFVMKLKYRRNGKYEDIPHFIINKNGEIFKVFDTKYSSKTFDDFDIDKKFIKIALENLGWLNKNTITGVLYNWVHDPYRLDPYVKNWRGYFFWDKYTDKQLESLVNLCKELCEGNKIPYQIVPSQGYIENLVKFKGIVCKSNFMDIYKDINPSFDFKLFNDNAKTEQL